MPHFGDHQCRTAELQLLPAKLTPSVSAAIAAGAPSCVTPFRYLPQYSQYLEIVDLGIAPGNFHITMEDAVTALAIKAHRVGATGWWRLSWDWRRRRDRGTERLRDRDGHAHTHTHTHTHTKHRWAAASPALLTVLLPCLASDHPRP